MPCSSRKSATRQKLDRKIVAEEHWVRYGVTARRKRNVRRMAGLSALRQAARDAKKAVGEVRISVAEGKISGRLVVEAEQVAKSYDGRPIIKDLSLRVLRGDRLALVGPNGAGKTTLINLLTGVLEPDSGTIRLGTSLQMATLDQRRSALDPNATLADTLTGGGSDWVEINGEKKHVIGYMKDFLFPPEQARTPDRQAVGRRARPPPAGPRPVAAVQLPRARRTDQRPRPGDARPAAGNAGGLSRHDPAGQPRPRFSRSRRRLGTGLRRRRPTGSNMPAATATWWRSAVSA